MIPLYFFFFENDHFLTTECLLHDVDLCRCFSAVDGVRRMHREGRQVQPDPVLVCRLLSETECWEDHVYLF